MTRGFSILLLLCAAGWTTLRAQISPGELSAAHASLEGLGGCTSCHELGAGVDGRKCLACHAELRTRIEARRGFHATVAGKKCVECHKEHFGRTFAIVRFDTLTFDHARVGFRLEGKHRTAACRTCHQPRNIAAADVRSGRQVDREKTFLGLAQACATCHADVHRGQFREACTTCHTANAWKPATGFAHQRTRFPLTGRHATAACSSCHAVQADGVTRRFAGVQFGTCAACHTDPHRGRFTEPCARCHSTEGWRALVSTTFDHSRTRFPLQGMHRSVACATCHRPSTGPGGRGTGWSTARRFGLCADCHADPHRGEFASGRYGNDCSACHAETGYRPSLFQHEKAQFRLEGKHATTPCVRCHPAPATPGAPRKFLVARFGTCQDCHADAHAGQIAGSGRGQECATCHTVAGFSPSTMTATEHARTNFPLTDAHSAVPCVECHQMGLIAGKRTRRFAWEGQGACATCHKDPHDRQFTGKPWEPCASCHVSRSWNTVRFAHAQTGYTLDGRHASVACGSCHRTDTRGAGRFTGTPRGCDDCHGQRRKN